MLYRVTFIQRDGTPGKPTLFHTVESANDYATIVMGTVEIVYNKVVKVGSRLNYYSEPHQIGEASTDAEIAASDNKVIRDSIR
jgi:hypothetical protein